jgi:hypothetical protein
VPATLERGGGGKPGGEGGLRGGAGDSRYAAGRGQRLDKRWARDRGRGGDDLPSVTARQISARG